MLVASTAAKPAISLQVPPQKIDVSKLGPQVGERVPDFSLIDQNGKTSTLQSIMGPKGAILLSFGGLVTLLQDAARGAAKPGE